jgi:shikimate kinase
LYQTQRMHPANTSKIFLIGFMGSGKTHWARLLSASHQLSYADLDDVIEKEYKRKIADIFAEKGEGYFREIEAKAIRSFANEQNCIIACGGGTPCYQENMQWMNENGITVYLKDSPAVLVKRLIKEKAKRPILMNVTDDELENFIAGKLKEREAFYNQAKIIVNEETTTTQQLVDMIFNTR